MKMEKDHFDRETVSTKRLTGLQVEEAGESKKVIKKREKI